MKAIRIDHQLELLKLIVLNRFVKKKNWFTNVSIEFRILIRSIDHHLASKQFKNRKDEIKLENDWSFKLIIDRFSGLRFEIQF